MLAMNELDKSIDMDKEVLIEQISWAFSGVALGSGIGLREANYMDYDCDDAEIAEERENDERQDWRNISSNTIRDYCFCVAYMDAESLRFHLPAIMIAELQGEDAAGLVFHLTWEPQSGHWVLLNMKQRIAVRAFLSYMLRSGNLSESDKVAVREALKNYWAAVEGE